jgi:hypothetical protein
MFQLLCKAMDSMRDEFETLRPLRLHLYKIIIWMIFYSTEEQIEVKNVSSASHGGFSH